MIPNQDKRSLKTPFLHSRFEVTNSLDLNMMVLSVIVESDFLNLVRLLYISSEFHSSEMPKGGKICNQL